jgi:peptidoglycan-associated lipoprotein
MKFLKSLLIVSMVLLALNGCSSKGGAEGEEAAGAAGAGGPAAKKPGGPRIGKYGQGGEGGAYGTGGAGAYGAGGAGAGGGELDNPSGPLAKRVIYFMYDSYEVLPEYQPVVAAHANYLATHPEQNAVLEGHADERGSPEYNIALGEQRAKAVLRVMQLQGVGDGQIQVVSFGEEKPSAPGHDESSWQQNRRVEISYPGH